MNSSLVATILPSVWRSTPQPISKPPREELPLEQLLTETDKPGGAKWLTGDVGLPQLVRQVVEDVALLKESTAPAIAQAVRENFLSLIQRDRWLSEILSKMMKKLCAHHLSSFYLGTL